jgi:hypothetical protein
MLLLIVVLILVFGVGGSWPAWGYSQGWGYGPSGILGVVLVVLLISLLLGHRII